MAICRVWWSSAIWVDESDNSFPDCDGDMTPEQIALTAADIAREGLIDGSMSGFTVIVDDRHGFLVDLEARDGTGGEPYVVNSWIEEEAL